MSKVAIRPAKKEDMSQVHQLIKDLAEFEKLQHQVNITPETLIEDGFGSDPPAFKCFVAEHGDSRIVGYALYYTCYSTWLGKSIFLEDLYVHPDFRKGGIGKQLVLAVAKVAYDTSKRLDFHVLSWNPAIEFYQRIGARSLTEAEKWHLFRIDEDALEKLFKN